MAGVVGIEPTFAVLETAVLAVELYPYKLVEGDGFEPPNPKERIYSPPRLANFATPPHNNRNKWCRPEDLNPQPTDYKSVALPVELGRPVTKWWLETESNRRHADFQSAALPTELSSLNKMAGLTGIEPAISCVTGRHVNRYTTGPF